jgi:hypothetical protein
VALLRLHRKSTKINSCRTQSLLDFLKHRLNNSVLTVFSRIRLRCVQNIEHKTSYTAYQCRVRLVSRLECFGRELVANYAKQVFDHSKCQCFIQAFAPRGGGGVGSGEGRMSPSPVWGLEQSPRKIFCHISPGGPTVRPGGGGKAPRANA